MRETTITELLEATAGELIAGEQQRSFHAVSTDTRALGAGSAFFALKGENFDAHAFLAVAAQAGAEVLIIETVPDGAEFQAEEYQGVSVVLVKDVLGSLQDFAAWYRQSLDIIVIGITGSNGKTSTKDFTRDVLSQSYRVSATRGNLNNHIGLPLNILSTEPQHQVCIWEMGMNHPGEIAPLCEIARPDYGIITNIGTAHIEYMGSRDAIASEKGELARALSAKGALFVPESCDYKDKFEQWTPAKVISIGGESSRVRAECREQGEGVSRFTLVAEGEESVKVELPVMGQHMIENALLAVALGVQLGMDLEQIRKGLESSELTSGRLRSFSSHGVSVLDDTYNANLESVRAGLRTLSEVGAQRGGGKSGRTLAVLGLLAELGEHTDSSHLAIGELAASLGISLLSVGDEAKLISEGARHHGGEAQHASSIESAVQWLSEYYQSGDTVLFKGSRAAGIERVMNQVFPG